MKLHWRGPIVGLESIFVCMDDPNQLPIEIQQFISDCIWTFAKTMPEWPHEYIVRDRVDEKLFVTFAEHIRKHGYEANFYNLMLTYFAYDGKVYWTMGEPMDETTIINRCNKDDTYEARRLNGKL